MIITILSRKNEEIQDYMSKTKRRFAFVSIAELIWAILYGMWFQF